MDNIRRLKMTLLTILIVLMILLITIFFIKRIEMKLPRIFNFSGQFSSEAPMADTTNTLPDAVEPIPTNPTMDTPTQTIPALPVEITRYVVDTHTVEWGECFSLITGDYWGDMFLWPDLYLLNDMKSDDPDLIYPNELIEIFNRLGKGDSYTARETDEILEAYVEVYKIYKALGSKKNNSAWSLLWCAAKYDKDFLTNYSDQIDPVDRAMAQKYINEKGIID